MKNKNISVKDDRATPEWLYNKLDKEFNFDFDPCPLMHDMKRDGLEIERWQRNFVNPPYSRDLKEKFVRKAIQESKKWKTCVCLLPVSTSTKLFHEHILPNNKDIRFLKWRVKFEWYNSFWEFVKNKTWMHDSMLIIF